MITEDTVKGEVTIWLEKGRELKMTVKEWEDLEDLIVSCYKKKPIEIIIPSKL